MSKIMTIPFEATLDVYFFIINYSDLYFSFIAWIAYS